MSKSGCDLQVHKASIKLTYPQLTHIYNKPRSMPFKKITTALLINAAHDPGIIQWSEIRLP